MVDITDFLMELALQTLSGILKNLAVFILAYLIVKTIVKEMPKWIEQYFRLRRDEEAIKRARASMDSLSLNKMKSLPLK